jgi:hypothetical protein
MMRGNENRGTNITITTEERIEINMKYLEWLYAKSKERKKQNKGLLDIRSAIELVLRDAGGEKTLKEIFLKEYAQKTIDELAKLDPTIEQTFRQDYQAGLQALSVLLADLEGND